MFSELKRLKSDAKVIILKFKLMLKLKLMYTMKMTFVYLYYGDQLIIIKIVS